MPTPCAYCLHNHSLYVLRTSQKIGSFEIRRQENVNEKRSMLKARIGGKLYEKVNCYTCNVEWRRFHLWSQVQDLNASEIVCLKSQAINHNICFFIMILASSLKLLQHLKAAKEMSSPIPTLLILVEKVHEHCSQSILGSPNIPAFQ